MAKLDELVLKISFSSQRRPQNAIVILETSNWRFHRGTAKFIAQTRKTSRRFQELNPGISHKFALGHRAVWMNEFFSS